MDIYVLIYGPYRNDEMHIVGTYSSRNNAVKAAVTFLTAIFTEEEDLGMADQVKETLAKENTYKKDGQVIAEIVRCKLD